MIDVFLAKEKEKGNLSVSLKPKDENILIHGHCHQKALFGTKSMKELLTNANVDK